MIEQYEVTEIFVTTITFVIAVLLFPINTSYLYHQGHNRCHICWRPY